MLRKSLRSTKHSSFTAWSDVAPRPGGGFAVKWVRGTLEWKEDERRVTSVAQPMGPARPRDAHVIEPARYGRPSTKDCEPHGSYLNGPPPAPN